MQSKDQAHENIPGIRTRKSWHRNRTVIPSLPHARQKPQPFPKRTTPDFSAPHCGPAQTSCPHMLSLSLLCLCSARPSGAIPTTLMTWLLSPCFAPTSPCLVSCLGKALPPDLCLHFTWVSAHRPLLRRVSLSLRHDLSALLSRDCFQRNVSSSRAGTRSMSSTQETTAKSLLKE